MKNIKKMSEKELLKVLKNELEEMEITELIEETMYITREGKMLSFGFEYGCRLNDHRIIFGAFEDIQYNDWVTLLQATGLLMVIPETMEAWTLKGKRLSKKQLEIINSYGLDLIRE